MQQRRPDLVLLDLNMPEMDGFAVLEKIQTERIYRQIPVIVITGQMLTASEMARLNQGVTAVLSKGLFTVQETLTHIEKALAPTRKTRNKTQQIVRQVMAYIHTHYEQSISFQYVSEQMNISASYLSRCFNHELGITPSVYLNRYRVNQARILLSTSYKNISEVAWSVGFTDTSYFTKVFRKETGMTPTDYVKKVHDKAKSPESSTS